jgi:Uncharacterized protein conserved in bacteria
MSSVTISINGMAFEVACDDGQEARLRGLAESIDTRVRALSKHARGANDRLLMVMVALMLVDELEEANGELERLREELHNASHAFEQGKLQEIEGSVAAAIEDIATKVEKIATRVEAKTKKAA